MSHLKKTQQQLQRYLLQGNKAVLSRIEAPPDMSSAERSDVYRHGYYLRLIDSLLDDYEKLAQLMGEDCFKAMAHDYFETHPSQTFTMRETGQGLADFLAEQVDCHPAYIEFARLEWLLTDVLFAKDSPVLTMDKLAQLSQQQWPTMCWQLNASIRECQLNYNTLAVWQALDAQQSLPDWLALPESHSCIIWRHDAEARFATLEIAEWDLLQQIKQGVCFAELCEHMLVYFSDDEAANWVATTMRQWIADGLLAGYH